MTIVYKYEIVSVDEQARCMEVVYSAQGYQDMRVGVRLPYEGEDLLAVLHSFSPVLYWEEQSKKVVIPAVGATGIVDAAALWSAPVQPATDGLKSV